jgi:hypothetical protein
MAIFKGIPVDVQQRKHDSFYKEYGPCCAGCDHWGWYNSHVGECTKSAMVPGEQRYALLGMEHSSLALEAGHVMTPREYVCGNFIDTYDWDSPVHPK